MNILFTCAGRRNYLLTYFRNEISNGKIIAADMSSTAPAFAEADIAITVPSVEDPEYINSLISIIREYSVDLLISLNDLELPVLTKNIEIFKGKGCKILVSDQKVIDTCFDKVQTIDFARELDIKTPVTFTSLEDAKRELRNQNVNFPLVVKPRWGSSSIGIEFPEDEKELELAYKLLDHRLDKTILGRASSLDRNQAILIQEKINGNEFGLDVINDFGGNLKAVIVKQKMAMRAGETDKAKTVEHVELQKLGSKIGENLKHIGNLDCDFFEDYSGNLYLLEMNPRFGGGYPFSHEAGVNLPKAIVYWMQGEEAPISCFNVTNGLVFSKCDYLKRISTEKNQRKGQEKLST